MSRVRNLTHLAAFGTLTCLSIAFLPALAMAQTSDLLRQSRAMKSAFREVVEGPSESTVRIISDDQDAALGAIVSADGYVISKASELRGKLVVKLRDGRTYPAQLIGVEELHDLALLKINANGLKPVEWRESKEAEVGHWVAAPGPGRDPVVAYGVVSVGTRKLSKRELATIRPTAPKSNSGYLGIILEPAEDGAPVIREVSEGGPADKAGLKAGDVVLTVAGRIIRSPDRLIATIQALRPGQTVSITVRRGDEEEDYVARLDRFPLEQLLDRGGRMNMLGSELSYRLGGFPIILQHDLVLKPSDCGGPLVDLDGKTVGINVARAGRTESYAIPSETVRALLPDLKSGKLAPLDEFEDKQVTLLRSMIRELRSDLAKAESKRKGLSRDASDAVRKAVEENVLELKMKLSKTREELDRLRNPKPKD